MKAPDKDPRPCIHYRKLNAITKAFFPLPNIEERVAKVAAVKYITALDLTKEYWQIPMTRNTQKLTAFVASFGSFLPLSMPFGLFNPHIGFLNL